MSSSLPPLIGDPGPADDSLAAPRRALGSPWRRFLAFVVDAIILAIVASAIALPFFDAFSRLGRWGVLVGFLIALPYFAILDSAIGGGQTLGKRWLQVQVVDVLGKPISFRKSVVRYAVFAIPYDLNNMSLPESHVARIVSVSFSVAIAGILAATCYLIVFNRHARQGIHDLAVGSYVTDANETGVVETQPTWSMHWAILASLLVVFSVAAITLGQKFEKWGAFPQMLSDVQAVENLKDVQEVGIEDLTNWKIDDEKQRIFVVSISWTGKPADQEGFADRVARLIFEKDQNAQKYDALRIVINRGYDLGIARSNVSRSFEHTPADWKARLSLGPSGRGSVL